MRVTTTALLIALLALSPAAIAQSPVGTAAGSIGATRPSSAGMPAVVVTPDTVFALLLYNGDRKDDSLEVEFYPAAVAAGAFSTISQKVSAEYTRTAKVSCGSIVFRDPEPGPRRLHVEIVRAKLTGMLPAGVTVLPAGGGLSGRVTALDPTGRTAAATMENMTSSPQGFRGRWHLLALDSNVTGIEALFSVLDGQNRLAGFGVRFRGGVTSPAAVAPIPPTDCFRL